MTRAHGDLRSRHRRGRPAGEPATRRSLQGDTAAARLIPSSSAACGTESSRGSPLKGLSSILITTLHWSCVGLRLVRRAAARMWNCRRDVTSRTVLLGCAEVHRAPNITVIRGTDMLCRVFAHRLTTSRAMRNVATLFATPDLLHTILPFPPSPRFPSIASPCIPLRLQTRCLP